MAHLRSSAARPTASSRSALGAPFYLLATGIVVAIALLTMFHGLVQGAVHKAQDARHGVRMAAERDARCRLDALRAPSSDLCMLQVAVSPRLVHQAGARGRVATGLQARAD